MVDKCMWIKGKEVQCRCPEMIPEPIGVLQQVVLSIRCVSCLLGWQLELNELDEKKKDRKIENGR